MNTTQVRYLLKRLRLAGMALLLLVMFSVVAHAQLTNGQFTTASDGNGGLIITAFSATGSGPLVIPSTIKGLPVTGIGEGAFYSCINLTSVTIPNSVTSIGEGAFVDCINLTSVTIPGSVTSIGDEAFNSCTSLSSVTIPTSVTSIGEAAFEDCINLTSATIPSSVISIGDNAFCFTSLISVTIPSSVTSIGFEAFGDCLSLTSITVDTLNPVYSSNVDGVLFDLSQTTLIQYPNGKAKAESSYTIPNGVTSIGDRAFYDCNNLTSVTIPNSVTSIGKQAFQQAALTSVTIPDSVTSIGDGAFSVCGGMTSATIGDGVTSIGEEVFMDCYDLTSVTISGSITSIGVSAFYNCTSLTNATIPNSVTSIGDCAFFNCRSLTSVTIPNSVTSIGVEAFSDCGLTSVTIPNSVTSIGGSVFAGCTSLSSVTIPSSVNSIGVEAFVGCFGMTTVTIPGSVTSIGDNAFNSCWSLTSAIFAGNAPSTGAGVFEDAAEYAASDFTVYYRHGATGFTSPTWTNSSGDSYPATDIEPFSFWEANFSFSGAATDIPQNDGVPNLLKYLYDINPSGPMSASDRAALPTVGVDTTTKPGTEYLTLTYRKNAFLTGITINVQTSSNLQTWTTVSPPDLSQQVGTDSNTHDPIMEVGVKTTGTRQFIRLNVTSP